jgi:flavodoxin I
MSQPIAIFYGSTTGDTETAAEDIQSALQDAGLGPVELFNVANADLKEIEKFEYLLFGISTWNIGELQDDWDFAFSDLDDIDFTGKTVALFGMGDQLGYPDNYMDALGILGKKVREQGATIIGKWSVEGYEHYESLGVEDGVFLGLALDNTNQGNLTDDRIAQWVPQIIQEFGFESTANA